MEWVLAYLDASSRPDLHDNDNECDLPQNIAAVQASNNVEDQALSRMLRVVDVMLRLSKCYRVQLSSTEVIIGGLARVYRSAEFTARRLLTHKGKIRKSFQQLMHKIGGVLNEAMYDLLMRSVIRAFIRRLSTFDANVTAFHVCRGMPSIQVCKYRGDRLQSPENQQGTEAAP